MHLPDSHIIRNEFAGAAEDPRIGPLGLSRDVCVAFTGYRPSKFRVSFPQGGAREAVDSLVRPVVRELYDRGVRYFLSGMADGFDLWAADAVLALRDGGVCPEAGIVAVVPFRGQADRYSREAAALYGKISREAVLVTVLSEVYSPECFHRRNDFLVANASCVVCYYDGQSGGTQYTVRMARRSGLQIVNLCAPELRLY